MIKASYKEPYSDIQSNIDLEKITLTFTDPAQPSSEYEYSATAFLELLRDRIMELEEKVERLEGTAILRRRF